MASHHLAADGQVHPGHSRSVCTICGTAARAKRTGRSGATWRKRRLLILDRDNWICADCGQHADTVHLPYFWGPNHHTAPDHAFESLCKRCHGRRDGARSHL